MASLNFNALVIEITERCNARCAMCYQAAGPKGSDIRGDPSSTSHRSGGSSIKPACCLSRAADLPVGRRDIHRLSEGDRSLSPRQDEGFERIGTSTNAFWATRRPTAIKKTRELAEAGLNYFEVSIDYWHLPYVKLACVRNLLWASRQLGVTVILRTLSTKSHHIDELLEHFTASDLIHVLIGNGRVHLIGRGASPRSPPTFMPEAARVAAKRF